MNREETNELMEKFYENHAETVRQQLETIIKVATDMNVRLAGKLGGYILRKQRHTTITFTSPDLAKRMSPRMFKEMDIYANCNTVFDMSEEDRTDTKGEDYRFLFNIRYSYEHFKGGSNGCDIGMAWFSEDGELVDSELSSIK